MSSLTVATLVRAGAAVVDVVSRTPDNAVRLATSYGGRGGGLDTLPDRLAEADLLVSCTGAVGLVVSRRVVADAMGVRPERALAVLDLALPRDVDPAVRDLPGVHLTDLESLHALLETEQTALDVALARTIVAEEVGTALALQRATRVAPTVVALRTKAAEVVEAELARLDGRVPDLEGRARAEVASTVRRVVEKLLHTPTVRVKQLAETPGGQSYAEALEELFGLDLAAVEAVTRADVTLEDTP
jgi:glutamyl-tRNA reductase